MISVTWKKEAIPTKSLLRICTAHFHLIWRIFPRNSFEGKVMFLWQMRTKLIWSNLRTGTCTVDISLNFGFMYIDIFCELKFASVKFSTFRSSIRLTGFHINHDIQLCFPIVYQFYHSRLESYPIILSIFYLASLSCANLIKQAECWLINSKLKL